MAAMEPDWSKQVLVLMINMCATKMNPIFLSFCSKCICDHLQFCQKHQRVIVMHPSNQSKSRIDLLLFFYDLLLHSLTWFHPTPNGVFSDTWESTSHPTNRPEPYQFAVCLTCIYTQLTTLWEVRVKCVKWCKMQHLWPCLTSGKNTVRPCATYIT